MRTILVRLLLAIICVVGTELAFGQSPMPQPAQTVQQSDPSAQSGATEDGIKAGDEKNDDTSPKPKAKTKKHELKNNAKQKRSYEDFYHDVFELNKTI